MTVHSHRCGRSTLLLAVCCGLLPGCGSPTEPPPEAQISPPADTPPKPPATADRPSPSPSPGGRASAWPMPEGTAWTQPTAEPEKPVVVMETSLGAVRVELDAGKAPVTVENFLSMCADRGFYDGTIFHHVEPGSLIVAGGYDTQLKPKSPRVFIRNEADNGLKNVRGTIAMVREPDHIDSASCQFFFNLRDNPQLDHQPLGGPQAFGYCVFGRVVEGMEILDQIGGCDTTQKGVFPAIPVHPITLLSLRRER